MNKALGIIFPDSPTPVYFFLRNLLVLGICLFFLVRSLNIWLGFRLDPRKTHITDNTHQTEVIQGREKDSADEVIPETRVITQRNIFGGSPVQPEEKNGQEQAIELEEIPLAVDLKEFKLIGTMIGSDRENRAVIENTSTQQQGIYVVADQLKHAQIKKILRNNVIVNDGKQDEMLSLDYKVRARLAEGKVLGRSGSASAGEERAEQSYDLSADLMDDALSNINDILQQVRIRPYLSKGKHQGFEIRDIAKGSFFDAVHLQDGDVLLGTARTRLDNPEHLLPMINKFRNKNKIHLRIKRNNREMIIHYNLH